MARETTYQRLKRELLETRQKLFKVCTEPETISSKTIIIEQRVLKYQHDMLMRGSYLDSLKGSGILDQVQKPYVHYEAPKQ